MPPEHREAEKVIHPAAVDPDRADLRAFEQRREIKLGLRRRLPIGAADPSRQMRPHAELDIQMLRRPPGKLLGTVLKRLVIIGDQPFDCDRAPEIGQDRAPDFRIFPGLTLVGLQRLGKLIQNRQRAHMLRHQPVAHPARIFELGFEHPLRDLLALRCDEQQQRKRVCDHPAPDLPDHPRCKVPRRHDVQLIHDREGRNAPGHNSRIKTLDLENRVERAPGLGIGKEILDLLSMLDHLKAFSEPFIGLDHRRRLRETRLRNLLRRSDDHPLDIRRRVHLHRDKAECCGVGGLGVLFWHQREDLADLTRAGLLVHRSEGGAHDIPDPLARLLAHCGLAGNVGDHQLVEQGDRDLGEVVIEIERRDWGLAALQLGPPIGTGEIHCGRIRS